MTVLAELAAFNAWVNRRLFACAARLPDAAYRADEGLFFGSVHRTLNHVLVVDRLWSGRISGTDRGVTRLDQVLYDDLGPLTIERAAEDARLSALVDGLGEAALDRPVRWRTVDGAAVYELSPRRILHSLFNHQTHHRGQVHAVLTRHGIEPPALDLVFHYADTGDCRKVEPG